MWTCRCLAVATALWSLCACCHCTSTCTHSTATCCQTRMMSDSHVSSVTLEHTVTSRCLFTWESTTIKTPMTPKYQVQSSFHSASQFTGLSSQWLIHSLVRSFTGWSVHWVGYSLKTLQSYQGLFLLYVRANNSTLVCINLHSCLPFLEIHSASNETVSFWWTQWGSPQGQPCAVNWLSIRIILINSQGVIIYVRLFNLHMEF